MLIEPHGKSLGESVEGLGLSRATSEEHSAALLNALGTHGALCFSSQSITPRQLRGFSARLGSIQRRQLEATFDPEYPEDGHGHRLIKSCQVMADLAFDLNFVSAAQHAWRLTA